jgi:hypothetical protein
MLSDKRRGEHDWGSTLVEDRLGKRIPHDQRFAVPRIPALVELWIQAGVDLPEYPTVKFQIVKSLNPFQIQFNSNHIHKI